MGESQANGEQILRERAVRMRRKGRKDKAFCPRTMTLITGRFQSQAPAQPSLILD